MAVGRARSSKNAYIVVSNVSPSKNAFCIGLRFFERVSLTRQNRSCPIHALPKKRAVQYTGWVLAACTQPVTQLGHCTHSAGCVSITS